MNMLPSTRDEVHRAVTALALRDDQIRLLSPYQYRQVLGQVAEAFLTVGTKGLGYYWWWEVLREPHVSRHTGSSSLAVLSSLLPSDETVWFLANDTSKKQDAFWVYEEKTGSIVRVLRECYGFEYFVVSKRLDWLVGEHHSEVLVAAGERMTKALESARPSSVT